MYPHLTKLIEKDTRVEKPIMPVSRTEAEIIVELVEIFRKLDRDELKDVLRLYKEVPDKEIRDLLLEWNISNDGVIKQNSDDGTRFIDFDGTLLKLSLVSKISKGEFFDMSSERLKYFIVINEDTENRAFYSNTRVEYISKTRRNHIYNKLKNQLSENGITFL